MVNRRSNSAVCHDCNTSFNNRRRKTFYSDSKKTRQVKNYYFIEDYINPGKSPAELSFIWVLCVLLIVGLPYFSHKIEKLLDKEKKD